MPAAHHLLIDPDATARREPLVLSSETDAGDKWHVRTRTLHGGVSEGVEVVEIDNGALSFAVLPTRGLGVWKAVYRGLPVGWNSPVARPVHPAFVPLSEPLGWLRGFNELLCRCGLTSNGPPGPDPGGNPVESPLPLHGRVANLPAHRLELVVDGDALSLVGEVDEVCLFGSNLRLTSTISTVAGSNAFEIHDTVTNRAAVAGESQLLYHVNVGPPFLEAGSRIVVPAAEVAPRDAAAVPDAATWDTLRAPTAGDAEQAHFVRPRPDACGESVALLRNASGDLGVSVHFAVDRLPYLSLWKHAAAPADGYVVGLEPGTNYPNPRSFERTQGRIVRLAPGASYETRLRLAVHDTRQAVAALESAVSLTQTLPPTLHEKPRPGWHPG